MFPECSQNMHLCVGGVVVCDCVDLMRQLLAHNASNQKYFVEIGCVAHLHALLTPSDPSRLAEADPHGEAAIVHKAMRMLLDIARNCGHMASTQSALLKIAPALLSLAAQPHDSALVERALILLRVALHLNADSAAQFLGMKTALALLTRLTLRSSAPHIAMLAEATLKALFLEQGAAQRMQIETLWRVSHSLVNVCVGVVAQVSSSDADINPLRFWMATRALAHLFGRNQAMKRLALTKKSAATQCFLSETLMRALLATAQKREALDQRVQLGLLLLLASLGFESRAALHALFAREAWMQCVVALATAKAHDAYVRGLSTFILAECLEFARDLAPMANGSHGQNDEASGSASSEFSVFLVSVVRERVSVDVLKANLDALRETPEYRAMRRVCAQCRERVGQEKKRKGAELARRCALEELFAREFDLEKGEFLGLRENKRFKFAVLFDAEFVRRFEAIYAVIDQRIIRLISCQASRGRLGGGGEEEEHKASEREAAMASELEVLRREKAQFEREMEALRRQQAERIDTNMHAINAAGEKDLIVGAIREMIIIQRHFFFLSQNPICSTHKGHRQEVVRRTVAGSRSARKAQPAESMVLRMRNISVIYHLNS